ncbi:molecular chaperone DnaJ [Malaciobacter molluscorum LMG 25693]|uniref:DnaJ domain-containing protein n=1 Tax=Malaciobacter molluscorum LMG 25693 TaxID=870501 RepID=A0A2G1DIF1_9BACT|nr:J domain-containing protein [Malaciobacter molluscorum]AXX91873.1 DnaJ domain-containing protein [Malaciobacter molluscorum LMG 25693]PHO18282.1 molecular chaperone DnaJ [Malaciobacter molluscorum LMG 25693]RXJ94165.1 molecular chaperone DnaJ [Malaciobacter molluscorum]
MNNSTLIYMFNKVLRTAILLFILYLIVTNFTTFLLVIAVIFLLIYFFIYKKLKSMSNGFKFTYTQNDFGTNQHQNFNFNDFDFNSFNQQFAQKPGLGEVEKAKEFFGFTHSPTKEEVKKRYKELAKKYHPDINGSDDTMMQQLNHYKDILLQYVG